jgi:hypothetical protein
MSKALSGRGKGRGRKEMIRKDTMILLNEISKLVNIKERESKPGDVAK